MADLYLAASITFMGLALIALAIILPDLLRAQREIEALKDAVMEIRAERDHWRDRALAAEAQIQRSTEDTEIRRQA